MDFLTQDFEREGVRHPDYLNDIYNIDALDGFSFFEDAEEQVQPVIPASSYPSIQFQGIQREEGVKDNSRVNDSKDVSQAQGYHVEPTADPTTANPTMANNVQSGGEDDTDVPDDEPTANPTIANPTVANNVQSQPMAEEDDDMESLFGGVDDRDVPADEPAEPLLELSNGTPSPQRKKQGRKSGGQENEHLSYASDGADDSTERKRRRSLDGPTTAPVEPKGKRARVLSNGSSQRLPAVEAIRAPEPPVLVKAPDNTVGQGIPLPQMYPPPEHDYLPVAPQHQPAQVQLPVTLYPGEGVRPEALSNQIDTLPEGLQPQQLTFDYGHLQPPHRPILPPDQEIVYAQPIQLFMDYTHPRHQARQLRDPYSWVVKRIICQEQVMEFDSVMTPNSRPAPVNPADPVQVRANDAIHGSSDRSQIQTVPMPAPTIDYRIPPMQPPVQDGALMPPPPIPAGYRNVVQQPVNTVMAPVPLGNPSLSMNSQVQLPFHWPMMAPVGPPVADHHPLYHSGHNANQQPIPAGYLPPMQLPTGAFPPPLNWNGNPHMPGMSQAQPQTMPGQPNHYPNWSQSNAPQAQQASGSSSAWHSSFATPPAIAGHFRDGPQILTAITFPRQIDSLKKRFPKFAKEKFQEMFFLERQRTTDNATYPCPLTQGDSDCLAQVSCSGLMEHIQTYHGGTVFACLKHNGTTGKRQFSIVEAMERHIRKDHWKLDNYICPHCGDKNLQQPCKVVDHFVSKCRVLAAMHDKA